MKHLINNKLIGSLVFALSLAYPLIVYFLGSRLPSSYIVVGLISLLVIRSAVQYRDQGAANIYMVLIIAAIMVGCFFLNSRIAIYIYPILMSLSFAFLLGWSLLYPPSLIERIARIMEPDLDSYGIAYTRKVTIVWLGFSLLNASISFATVIINNNEIWLLYNGLISYALMGLLMGSEYLYRGYYKNKSKGLPRSLIPVHLLLALKKDDFWKSYWPSNEFISYPHYIGNLIKKIKDANAKRVFVVSEDRAYTLAGFLAALYANIPAVLPQSNSPELLTDLMQPGDILLTDQPDLEKVTKAFLSMHLTYDTTMPIEFAPLDPKQAIVIFYTSGSTGKPKAVEKRLLQLEAEVEVLHNLWGQGAQGKFLSTVSHNHLYAFLYSLLWPVCSGFTLERWTFTYWGDLLIKSSVDDFLISSPSHLGRFSILGECPPQSFKYVFCSGAPLSYEAAIESKKHLGLLPIEVYGSTETGGIAFRQQEQPENSWQPFNCVELSSGQDNKLRVKSPYIDGNGAYQTEDQISWADANTFHLLGRADRIVKVEGKRTSLSEIENKLCKQDLVADAAVLVLDKSYRDELGAVVILSELGVKKLNASVKMDLIRQLREMLKLYFHPVVIPRKWRFVDSIPVNSQGKRLNTSLRKYFGKSEKAVLGLVRQPIILRKDLYAHRAEYHLKIPHNLSYCEGHFKSMPIVPGIVQLNWAVEFAKTDLKLKGWFSQGNQIKFTNIMKPTDEVSLVLEYNPEKSSVAYSYKCNQLTYSSGRITFAEGNVL